MTFQEDLALIEFGLRHYDHLRGYADGDYDPADLHEDLREADASRAVAALDRVREHGETARTALRGLLDHLEGDNGEPWDVDQDCLLCGGHYGEHFGCEWVAARAALAALDESPASTEERT